VRSRIFDENRRPRPSPGVPGDEESRQWMKQVGLSDPRRKEKNVEGREGEWDLSSWSPKGKGKGKLTVRSDNSDKF
jgi:hypothetical protein